MTMKFTVLCDNSAATASSVIAEHGFACYLESEADNYLFDTGQGLGIVHNSIVLKKDLSKIKAIMLSHGHYDHTGGLPAVLYPPRGVEVVAHPDIFTKKYAELQAPGGKQNIFIGIKYSRDYLEGALQARFNLIQDFVDIAPGIYFSGEVPKKTDFEHPDTRLKVEHNGKMINDPLNDDISLLVETDQGPGQGDDVVAHEVNLLLDPFRITFFDIHMYLPREQKILCPVIPA